MTKLFTLPKQVVIDPLTLLPSPGAKAYYYITGTSTPKVVYSDSDLTTPITQPVVADSAGVLQPIYLSGDAEYKLTLNRADDSLIYTVDPLDSLIGQTVLSTAIKYDITAAENNEGVTPFNYAKFPTPIRDLSRYVSDNTGTVDVSAAFNHAIHVSTDELLVPEGVYRIDSKLSANVQGKRIIGVSPWGASIVLNAVATDTCAIEVTARLIEISNLVVTAPNSKTCVYMKTAQLFRSNQLTVKGGLNGVLYENGNSSGIRNLYAESCVTGFLAKADASGNTNGSYIHGRSYNCTTGFNLDVASGGGLDSSYNEIHYSTEGNATGFVQAGGRYNELFIYSESNSVANWSTDFTKPNIWRVKDPDGTFPNTDSLSYANALIGQGLNLYDQTTWRVIRSKTQDFAASGSLTGIGVGIFYVTNSSGATKTMTLTTMSSAPVNHQCRVLKLDATAGFTLAAPAGMSLIDVGGTWGGSPTNYALLVLTKISSTQILVERYAA